MSKVIYRAKTRTKPKRYQVRGYPYDRVDEFRFRWLAVLTAWADSDHFGYDLYVVDTRDDSE